jgi:hypothetical protein
MPRLAATGALALALLGAEAIALAPRADAAHHLVRIRQVFPGFPATGSEDFAVLQLTAPNENLLTGATVTFYSAGATISSMNFMSNPGNGANQMTVLAATQAAETAFGVTADLDMPNVDTLVNSGGAVCLSSLTFPNVDCVEWGMRVGGPPLTSPAGTPEPVIPADNLIERSITTGCATLHEPGDDTNQSANDFFPVPISTVSFDPRSSSSPITETGCAVPPPGVVPSTPAAAPQPGKKKKRKKRKKKRKRR